MSSTLEKIQRQIAGKPDPAVVHERFAEAAKLRFLRSGCSGAVRLCEPVSLTLIFSRTRISRAERQKYANWPTFPQLCDGELVGGCDIVIEMYQRGEPQQLIKETGKEHHTDEPKANNSPLSVKVPTLKSLFYHSGVATGSGQPPRRFQRFTISQNSCAVCRYRRGRNGCAPSNGIPAAIQAFGQHRLAQRQPVSAAVSKVTNGTGLRRWFGGGLRGEAVVKCGVVRHHDSLIAVALIPLRAI